MKTLIILLSVIISSLALIGCSGSARHHQKPLGDPSAYKAHFPDMDSSGDDLVTWKEFNKHFPQANKDVFNALDLNKDSKVDHDEWHEFKEAHGLKDH